MKAKKIMAPREYGNPAKRQASQDVEASLVRQKEERNTLNWLEKLTSSVRPTIDKSSIPQFNGGADDDIKEFFLQFKRTVTFNK